MNTNDIALVTGASTPLAIEGKTVPVRPITFKEFGELNDIFIRMRMEYAPKVEEAVAALPVNSPRAHVAEIVRSVAEVRMALLEPSFDEIINWLMTNPIAMQQAIWLCIDEKDRKEIDFAAFSRTVLRPGVESDFMDRWMLLSGIKDKENPNDSAS